MRPFEFSVKAAVQRTARWDSNMQAIQEKIDVTTAFVRKAWYCAAWSHEVTDQLLPRKILDEPVLIFRNEAGEACAVRNLCSHKLAPLHLGKRIEGAVECGYHGLRFDGKGRCVFNPQTPGHTPAAADIRSYPIVEQDGVLWIWMDDPIASDPSQIADCGHLVASNRKTIYGRIYLKGNYLLLVDNLMDLGHAYYLHQASTGGLSNRHYEIDVSQVGDVIYDRRIARNLPGPKFLTRWLEDVTDDVCDHWQDIHWAPAAVLRNHVAAAPAGSAPAGLTRPVTGVVDLVGTHLLTPETTTTTHYFCATSRNYQLDNPEVDQFWRDWQRKGLQEEDSAMIERIEEMRSDAARLGMQPVSFLPSDSSGVKVMRTLARILEREMAEGT